MRFKYGDKVRIIGAKPNQVYPAMPKEMNMTIGLIGTVKGVDAKNCAYYVETHNPQTPFFTRFWYNEEWLAPVPYPKHIYKGDGKTVVMWEDGTKTIVKRAEGEPDNDYAAFTAALAIKVYGDNSKVNRIVRMTETVEKRKKKKKQKEDAERREE